MRQTLLLAVLTMASAAFGGGFQTRVQPIKAGMSVCYAVEGDTSICLIDAGSPGKEKKILRACRRFSDKPLTLILITHAHFDHYGSAAALRELTGARIAIHQDDAQAMAKGRTPIDSVRGWGRLGKPLLPLAEWVLKPQPTRADLFLHHGMRRHARGFPARIYHTPGHTRGSVCILFDGGFLFVSDLLVSRPKRGPQSYYAWSWEQIDVSVRRMQKLEPIKVFSGHSYKPMSPEDFLSVQTD